MTRAEIDAEELAALRGENAQLRALIQQVLEADESDAASGGEMWYAEQMCETVKNVRVAFNSTTPNPLYASAPEMLNVLEAVLGWIKEMGLEHGSLTPVKESLFEIIARAKGETAQP